MRNKSALITKTPLCSLSPQDFEKLKKIFPVYAGELSKSDERTFYTIRKERKHYKITIQDYTLNILAKNKCVVMKELKKLGAKPKEITKIVLVLENNCTKELTLPGRRQKA